MKNKNILLIHAKRLKCIEILGGKCLNCNNTDPSVLCFHHLDGETKEIEMSKIFKFKWNIIEKELIKCQLLCDNCHTELHFDKKIIDFSYRNRKNRILELIKKDKCEICGYNKCIASLHFHHTKKEEKKFNIFEIKKNFLNFDDLTDEILLELNKCELLCSNCHHKKHNLFFEEYKNEIYEMSKKIRLNYPKIDKNVVFKMLNDGYNQSEIAKFFNSSKSSISKILKNVRMVKLVDTSA